jgi:hypothetical protein
MAMKYTIGYIVIGDNGSLCSYVIGDILSAFICLTVPNPISVEIRAKRDAHVERGT